MNRNIADEIIALTRECLNAGVANPLPRAVILEAFEHQLDRVETLKYNRPAPETRQRAIEIMDKLGGLNITEEYASFYVVFDNSGYVGLRRAL